MNRLEFLLLRYNANLITKDEREELAQLLDQADDSLSEQLPNPDVVADASDADDTIGARISHSINQKLALADKKPTEVIPIQRDSFRWWGVAAATVALLLAVGPFLYNKYYQHRVHIKVADEVVSFKGKQFIALPDGSTVLTNEGSVLTYDASYGQDQRVVYLTGEAYFNVTPDPTRKFIVKSGNVNTTVLGTVFNVKAFPADAQIVVTVSSGKVSIEDDKQDLGTLTRLDQVIINTRSGTCMRTKVKAEEVAAWTNRFIIIADQRLEDALAVLASRFDKKIILENQELKNCRVNATFLEEPRLDDVLEVMSSLVNASYSIGEDGSVTIVGGTCK